MPEQRDYITETAKTVLEELLEKLEIHATVVPGQAVFTEPEDSSSETPVVLDIQGSELGILIGRKGQTLSCLQYLVRIITTRKTDSFLPIIVDVEGYKKRRYESLVTLAHRVADQVKARKASFRLEPMSPYERRIIHLTLAANPNVETESVGEGDGRRVVVMVKK